MTTIANAAAGIKAAQENLSKVGKASMTGKPTKQPKSIDKLKKRRAKIDKQLQLSVQPLDDRLQKMNMRVWWGGKEYLLNPAADLGSNDQVFRLDDHSLAQLMAMSDRKLESFLKGF